MDESVRATDSGRQYRRHDAALAAFMASGGSRTEAGAHAKELRTRRTMRALLRCYPLGRALRYLESLRRVLIGEPKPLTPERHLEADVADRGEDLAETRYRVAPTRAHQEAWVRALYTEAAHDLELARDLEAQR